MVVVKGSRRILAVAITALLMGPAPTAAQSRVAKEYDLKAAFLYNFSKFVDWPDDAFPSGTDTLTIGVLGDDPFGPALELTLAGKSVHDKRLAARRVHRLDDAAGCQMLFVSNSEEERLPQILSGLDGTGVLTVSEIPDFAARGGMIQFKMEGNKIHFDINLAAARRARLQISSQLLKLATTVISETISPGAAVP
jgi:uncharacterized protein DUF4154